MTINYKTYKYAGPFDKTVTVYYGPDGQTEEVIHLRGKVDPIPMGVLEIEPRKIILDALKAGQGNRVMMPIKNTGDAPLRLSKVFSSKLKVLYYDSEKDGEVVIPAGERHELAISVRPPNPGLFLDIVMVHSDARNDVGEGYKAVLSGNAQ